MGGFEIWMKNSGRLKESDIMNENKEGIREYSVINFKENSFYVKYLVWSGFPQWWARLVESLI